ncbi:Dabb family protein [Pelagicoccus sp. NFK12]|uniref:Dabb family protein n=1 Tax=Pelagicoccus enzymogenes TaxID=2773457 RepID=A0A927F8X1_9BACT|nr:Dabb family protein [Pelagicoccus enzymogenes]MBD5779891.1 Dabb family protein [Pelagicoccus enzymogenes]MDQ8200757.1 Dabb family protein [Pelagicoccus enzymogenes]
MKKVALTLISLACLAFGAITLNAAHHEKHDAITPGTVIHVVTVSWKADATDEGIQAALDGVVTLAKEYDGIERVWIKTIKAQGNRSHAFVMEFKNPQALKDYAGSAAQKKWYEVYYPVREGSTTFDITN